MLKWGFRDLIGGPHSKDYSMLGSILGFPYWEITKLGLLQRASRSGLTDT